MSNAIENVCQLPNYQHALIIFGVALFEAWLGKTNKVRASSIIDLLVRSVLWPFKKIFLSRGDKHEDNR